jgi:hypothetical protein
MFLSLEEMLEDARSMSSHRHQVPKARSPLNYGEKLRKTLNQKTDAFTETMRSRTVDAAAGS